MEVKYVFEIETWSLIVYDTDLIDDMKSFDSWDHNFGANKAN